MVGRKYGRFAVKVIGSTIHYTASYDTIDTEANTSIS